MQVSTIKKDSPGVPSNADTFKSHLYLFFLMNNSSEMQIKMRLTDFFVSPRNVSWIYL